jgi:sporulation protein YlmC with PRC-barrel domain
MVTANKLSGTSVITADAYNLGEVDGTNLDTESWKVTHLQILLTDEAVRELAFKKPFLGSVRICLPVTHISKVADVVTLKTSLTEVKSAPECKMK